MKKNVYLIRFEILEDINNRGCIIIGASLDNQYIENNIHSNEHNTYSYSCSDGKLRGFNQNKKYIPKICRSGSIIDLKMDMDKNEISLSIDSNNLGVLFYNVSKPLTPFIELLGNEAYGGGNQSVEIKVT